MNWSRGLLAAVMLGATGAHAAALGDNTVRLAPSQIKLPQNIGPMRFSTENRYSDRRMGRSFSYNANGISLNIYVYDYGVRDLHDGPDSVAACEQFENAKAEIEHGGNYQNVVARGEFTRRMRAAPSSPAAREATYELDRNGIHVVSVLWVTAADGHFMKVRLSFRAEVADELEEARAQILEAIGDAIAARPAKPAPTPVSPQQEVAIEVQANPDAASAAAWLAYAVELTRFSSEHPETRPPCGGQLQPGFAAELAARRAGLLEYRARATGNSAPGYFDELGRVEAAGFLEEYVWHYLRNERWDRVPPPGVDLGAFEPFRLRELATHAVQSGARVRINTVRALPAAPTP